MAYQHLKQNKQENYRVILSSKNVSLWLSAQRLRSQQSERFEFQHLGVPLILLSSVVNA